MRIEMAFDLGIKSDEVEYTAEFMWETGNLPLPRRGDRIWLGELVAIVAEVRYKCVDAETLDVSPDETPAVAADLWLRLTKRTRKNRYTPQETHLILSNLPSVSGLHVTGADV
ncbi:hypothetical protein [Streptomyces bacillaris]|uniref:hypothetical protein n=1 Tax=Streptomyces bacillaris TaxID=68179 RepID=UPI003809F632